MPRASVLAALVVASKTWYDEAISISDFRTVLPDFDLGHIGKLESVRPSCFRTHRLGRGAERPPSARLSPRMLQQNHPPRPRPAPLEASDPADLVPDRSQSFLGALEFNATVSVPMYAKYFFALQDCLGKPSQRRMSAPSSAILAVTEQLKGNKAGHESAVCPQTSF